jgi:hypothetical protein
MAQRRIELAEFATIGERIGSDIENAHDMRLGQIKNPVAARQPGRGLNKSHFKP